MVYHQIPIIIVRSWLVNPYYDDETFTHDAPSTSGNAFTCGSNDVEPSDDLDLYPFDD